MNRVLHIRVLLCQEENPKVMVQFNEYFMHATIIVWILYSSFYMLVIKICLLIMKCFVEEVTVYAILHALLQHFKEFETELNCSIYSK